jgi:hypothetical protein
VVDAQPVDQGIRLSAIADHDDATSEASQFVPVDNRG